MDIKKDYRKFALSQGLHSSQIDAQEKKQVTDMVGTPMILEERQMNVAPFDVFSRLMYDRIIFLSGEVSQDSMDTIVAQLLYLDSVDNRDINIYINSPGGDCYSGLELVSTMDFVKSDVSTTVLGLAASMGAIISSSGKKGKRKMLPYSRFMIHQPSGSSGRIKFTDQRIELEEMEKTRNDLYGVLSKNSGHSMEEIIDMCEHGDRWMKASEAIELGFADGIITKKS